MVAALDIPEDSNPSHYTYRYLRVVLYLFLSSVMAFLFHLEDGLRLPLLLFWTSLLVCGQYFLVEKRRLYFQLVMSMIACIYLFGIMAFLCVVIFLGLLFVVYRSQLQLRQKIIYVLFALVIGALFRGSSSLGSEWSTVVGILGVLVMFRVIVMFYDLYANKLSLDFLQYWNYYLMLPNFVFMIFPIVDTKVFVRSREVVLRMPTMERGVLWIIRGLYYVLLYRVIYFYLIPTQNEADSPTYFLVYCVLNYLLIYRLIGIFYISTGILCMMGYDLPKAFNNMFFASSFNDLWRRLNVYWKDFILKVFYLPMYFKFRKEYRNPIFGIFLLIFIINWFLHGYQWFWILGDFPLRDTDILFWLIFGVLVGINALVDQRTRLVSRNNSWMHEGLKVGGMFLFMSVFWTFWTSDSLNSFYHFVQGSNILTWATLAVWGITVLGFSFVAGGLKKFFQLRNISSRYDVISQDNQMSYGGLVLFLFVLIGSPAAKDFSVRHFGEKALGLYEEMLNEADSEKEFEGYYEELLEGASRSTDLNDLGAGRSRSEGDSSWTKLNETDIITEIDGIAEKHLKPNQSIIFKGTRFRTNEWGLRDRINYYRKEKHDSVYRIAIVGGSIEMGAGVEDDATFENLLEDSLNNIGRGLKKIEVINFAVSGVHMPQHVGKIIDEVRSWDVDCIFYFAHPNEKHRALRSFAKLMFRDKVKEHAALEEIRRNLVDSVGGEDIGKFYLYLRELKNELYSWGLDRISTASREMGAELFWVYVPTLGLEYTSEFVEMEEEASKKGFVVLDLKEAYSEHVKKDLAIAQNDRHPNTKGHYLLFKELFRQLEVKGYVNKWTN